MKRLYEITSARGIQLCHQVATTPEQAVEFAKMYGFSRAAKAFFVREA